MDVRLLTGMIERAREEKRRAEYYAAWVALLPLMQRGEIRFVSFPDYYDNSTGQNIDQRPAAEILAEAQEIRRQLAEGG